MAAAAAKLKYACAYCGMRVQSPSKLQEHERTHTGAKPFGCTVCGKMFARKGDVPHHARIHTGERHACSVCGRRFTQRGDAAVHERTQHPSEEPHGYSVYGKRFNARSEATKHERIHAGDQLPSLPHACGKWCHKPSTFLAGSSESSEDRPFACSVCGKAFGHKHHVLRHERTHNPDPAKSSNERPHVCGVCGKGCRDNRDLERHGRTHTGERPFSCSFCDKKFTQKSQADRHEQRLHTGQQPTTRHVCCGYCGKRFQTDQALARHEKTHARDTDRPVGTKVKPTPNADAAATKASTHRPPSVKPKPFGCSFCPKRFTEKSAQNRHERIHTGKRPPKEHACSFCPKLFPNLSERMRHERTHTGDKPHGCSLCDKKFAHKRTARAHEKTHASDQQLTQECGEAFLNAHGLGVHEQDHTRSAVLALVGMSGKPCPPALYVPPVQVDREL